VTAAAEIGQAVDEIMRRHALGSGRPEPEVGGFSPDLWLVLRLAGFDRIGVPEPAGGSGGSLGDALAAVQVGGAHAAAVPWVETITAGRLLADAGGRLPDGITTWSAGPVTVDPVAGTASGTLRDVPWGQIADHVVITAPAESGGRVTLVNVRTAGRVLRRSVADEPHAHLQLDGAPATTVGLVPEPHIGIGLSTVLLASMVAGAAAKAATASIEYAWTRQQFGQPIARFQAVQQLLTEAAEGAVVARMTIDQAVAAADTLDLPVAAEMLALVCADAAAEVRAAAHQIHGAIGMTRELPLQRILRRLAAWEFRLRTADRWSMRLGERISRTGFDQLYDSVSRPLTAVPTGEGA
jgi:acyl-CoA dehydrogenase